MSISYRQIDSQFLSLINEKYRIKFKRELLEHLETAIKYYDIDITELEKKYGELKETNLGKYLEEGDYVLFYLLCPYCNKSNTIGIEKDDDFSEPFHCVNCGENNPYYKLEESIKKVGLMLDIFTNEESEEKKRVILEQCIVLLATCSEVFLKDIYSTTINLRNVKRGYSLIDWFYSESKNDFINIGKTIKRFSKDLNINLKEIIDKESIKEINILMLKRNVIVHNNGIVDKSFLSQSGFQDEYNLMDRVEISYDEIDHYITVLDNLFMELSKVFEKEHLYNMIYDIQFNFV